MAETTTTKKATSKTTAKSTFPKVKITQVKSALDAKRNHKETLKSLGLRKIHQSVEKELNDVNKGYIRCVRHLILVEEVK